MAESDEALDAKGKEPHAVDSGSAIAPIDETTIRDLIYTVRGTQVMLDSDLAVLYGVETGALNRAAKRN